MAHSIGSSTEEDDDQLDALQYFINQLARSGFSTQTSKVTEETYHNILRLAVELREVATVVFVYRHMLSTIGSCTETYRIIETLHDKETKNRIHLPLEFDRQRFTPENSHPTPSEMLIHVDKIKMILTENPTLQTQKKALLGTAWKLYQIDANTVTYIIKHLERLGEIKRSSYGSVAWKGKSRNFWPDAT